MCVVTFFTIVAAAVDSKRHQCNWSLGKPQHWSAPRGLSQRHCREILQELAQAYHWQQAGAPPFHRPAGKEIRDKCALQAQSKQLRAAAAQRAGGAEENLARCSNDKSLANSHRQCLSSARVPRLTYFWRSMCVCVCVCVCVRVLIFRVCACV